MRGLEDQLARLRQAQAASGQQAAALRERLRRLQTADARGRVYLQTTAGEVWVYVANLPERCGPMLRSRWRSGSGSGSELGLGLGSGSRITGQRVATGCLSCSPPCSVGFAVLRLVRSMSLHTSACSTEPNLERTYLRAERHVFLQPADRLIGRDDAPVAAADRRRHRFWHRSGARASASPLQCACPRRRRSSSLILTSWFEGWQRPVTRFTMSN